MKVLKVLILLCLSACTTSKEEQGKALYKTHCASCHLAPDPQDLPKDLWKDRVLPEMAARMGIKDSSYSPYSGYSFREQEAIIKTGIYHRRPSMSLVEWNMLREYIIKTAPVKLDSIRLPNLDTRLSQFTAKPVNLDSIKGSSITFLDIEPKEGLVVTADLNGKISEYDYLKSKTVFQDKFARAITAYSSRGSSAFVTMVGNLNPSEIPLGKIYKKFNGGIAEIADTLHRPVHTSVYDFDKNGSEELVVSEFGNLTGSLSMWSEDEEQVYQKQVLLAQPGIIQTIVKDMNRDNKADIIVLSTQGNEGISILYHTERLNFRTEQIIRFNPVHGSSWFNLVDYNNDGYDDIIVVQGDNADKTYVNKPYHGMRIYINDGKNQFEEKFFYPLYGATRFVANDFDQDGDIDIGIVSSFPDYERHPEHSFVYLENVDSENFKFKSFGLENPSVGRWLLMDSGDIDKDGDEDIILSSFTYYFTPVPDNLFKEWSGSNVDLMVLENKLH